MRKESCDEREEASACASSGFLAQVVMKAWVALRRPFLWTGHHLIMIFSDVMMTQSDEQSFFCRFAGPGGVGRRGAGGAGDLSLFHLFLKNSVILRVNLSLFSLFPFLSLHDLLVGQ